MTFQKTNIEGVWVIIPQKFGDKRGYFMETWKQEEFDKYIPGISFVQDNESRSSFGVLRGLHYQRDEWSQAKLVRVTQGKVIDVIVDLRAGSKTFGQHFAIELSEENSKQLWIPRGFAHGFVVLSESATFQYKVDNVYNPESEGSLLFNDPELGIDWQVRSEQLNLSEKDLKGKPLSETMPLKV